MTIHGYFRRCHSLAPLLLAASLGSAGCGSAKPAAPEAPSTTSAETPPAASAAASENKSAPDTPVSSPETPSDADPADADQVVPKDCNFRVKGFCFKTDEEACAAAGCEPARCTILESHPARVKCK